MSVRNGIRAAAAVAACMAAAACGTAQAEQPHASKPAPPRVVDVVARDFNFEAPDQVAAGLTTFHLVNRGSTLHHMALIRLDAGKTVQDLFAAVQAGGPPPAWAHDMGGPNAVDPAGGEGNATMVLTPGDYVMLCFVDMPGGVPHVMKGMVHPLKVTEPAVPAASLPDADVVMRLNDYSFTLSRPITAGRHTVRMENGAAQSHEVEVVKFAPGKTTQDLMAWMQNPQGPPPASALGGVAGMAPGVTESFSMDFTPGHYALLCFIPDAKDGKPHFMHGMVQEFTVG